MFRFDFEDFTNSLNNEEPIALTPGEKKQKLIDILTKSAGRSFCFPNCEEKFDDEYASILADLLKQPAYQPYQSLKVFRISFNDMTDKGVCELVAVLRLCPHLILLDFQATYGMTDVGLKAIADLLAENSSITTAYLEKPSKITAQGGAYLAEKVFERQQKFPGASLEIAIMEGCESAGFGYYGRLKELSNQAVEPQEDTSPRFRK